MTLRIVTEPASTLLVPLADLKAQLRVDDTDSDVLITSLGYAAQNWVEAQTQRRYLSQTLEWVRDGWTTPMPLPVAGPSGQTSEITINSVKYVDLATGDMLTLDPSLYWQRPCGQTAAVVKRWFVVWPWVGDGAERVVINFAINGVDASGAQPLRANVAHAIKFLVSHWFRNRDAVVGVDNRDSSTPVPLGVEDLIFPERWSV